MACWGAEMGEVMETAHTWEEVGSQKQRKQRELKLFAAAQPLPGGWPGPLAPPLGHLPRDGALTAHHLDSLGGANPEKCLFHICCLSGCKRGKDSSLSPRET